MVKSSLERGGRGVEGVKCINCETAEVTAHTHTHTLTNTCEGRKEQSESHVAYQRGVLNWSLFPV